MNFEMAAKVAIVGLVLVLLFGTGCSEKTLEPKVSFKPKNSPVTVNIDKDGKATTALSQHISTPFGVIEGTVSFEELSVSIQPKYLPLKLSASTKGEVKLECGKEFITPIGVFEFSGEMTIAELKTKQNRKETLLVGLNNKGYLFDLSGKNSAIFQNGLNANTQMLLSGSMRLKDFDWKDPQKRTILFHSDSLSPRAKSISDPIKSWHLEDGLWKRRIDWNAIASGQDVRFKPWSIQQLSLLGTSPFPELKPIVKVEDRQAVIRFLVGASDAEIYARRWNNPLFAASYFSGDSYKIISDGIQSVQQAGCYDEASINGERSRVTAIRYPDDNTIEVDAIEVWSHTRYQINPSKVIEFVPEREIPQTLTIDRRSPNWYIQKVRFHAPPAKPAFNLPDIVPK